MNMKILFRACRAWPVINMFFLLAGCVALPAAPDAQAQRAPEVRIDETAMLPLLGYFQLLQRMTPAELAQQRQILAAGPQTPSMQIRLAMVFGLSRTNSDLAKAHSLLEGILRSTTPEAVSVHPLAGIVAAYCQERLKLETQNDKLAHQLRESLRRNEDLQEKLDALANIERSIPVRPGVGKTQAGGR